MANARGLTVLVPVFVRDRLSTGTPIKRVEVIPSGSFCSKAEIRLGMSCSVAFDPSSVVRCNSIAAASAAMGVSKAATMAARSFLGDLGSSVSCGVSGSWGGNGGPMYLCKYKTTIPGGRANIASSGSNLTRLFRRDSSQGGVKVNFAPPFALRFAWARCGQHLPGKRHRVVATAQRRSNASNAPRRRRGCGLRCVHAVRARWPAGHAVTHTGALSGNCPEGRQGGNT